MITEKIIINTFVEIEKMLEDKRMICLKDYKFSKYNHKLIMNGDVYVYNAFSGGFCRFHDDNREIVSDIDFSENTCLEKIAQLPSDVISGLIKGCFIIPKKRNEFAIVKSRHFVNRFSDTNSLTLTLIPTMACNFRCTYCFEADKHYPNNCMSDEVIDAILNLIDSRLKENGQLVITWYGGEPLLRFDIVKKLQSKILRMANKKKLTVNSAIITNGYLLTKEVSDELVEQGIRFAQVTIDGTKEIHNSKRIAANGEGSFDTIIKNILGTNSNLKISIRVNIDKDNIEAMPEFMDYLVKIGITRADNISLYFAVVKDYGSEGSALCSHYTVKEYAKEEVRLNEIAYSKGIYIHKNINPNIYVCGSLTTKAFVIEPDGTIQKCWGLAGDKNSAVGSILNLNCVDENYMQNQAKWYSWTKFDNPECKECKVLPICMGGCPLHTIDEKLNDDYKCSTYKYNMESMLNLIATKYLDDAY